jgi:phosphoserine aminotransferase
MEETRALVKELMQLKEDREVLFLHGGGWSQFYMVPMNLLNEDETAEYFDTGRWAHGAMEEAKVYGKVHVACSSKEQNYNHIPKNYSISDSSIYLHITSNNTVYGTQLHWWPETKIPVVADMSSDIFSRQLDFNRFDLIYAVAQKNMGIAGTTMVVLNKNLLGSVKRHLPRMLDYKGHIEAGSMANTPSVFAVYVSYLTLQWIKKEGLKTIEERNRRKAQQLYDTIDASSLFKGSVAKEDRSSMNVCFVMNEKALEEKFLDYASKQGIVGIKGYRVVGGFRASIYNAMPESGVAQLVEAMKEFERTA